MSSSTTLQTRVVVPTDLAPATSAMRLGAGGLLQTINDKRPRFSAELFHLNHQDAESLGNARVIVFSISNPLEYKLLFDFCRKTGIPARASCRSDDMPLFVGGGIGFVNPEPLADFFDVIVCGLSFQPLMSLLYKIELLRTAPRQIILRTLCNIPNLYIPSLIHPEYLPDGRIKTIRAEYSVTRQDSPQVSRPLSGRIAADEAILMPDIGCRKRCSFCALAHFYDYQAASIDHLKAEIDTLSAEGVTKIKLNSATAFQYKHISELLAYIDRKDLTVALGSVRIDQVNDTLLSHLDGIHRISETQFLYRAKPANGAAALTFGIESASNRLLKIINKDLTLETIKEQILMLTKYGLNNVGYYFISGIPTETQHDINAVADLITFTVRAFEAVEGEVFINVNPLIPTPNTQMQRVEIISENRFKDWFTLVQERIRAAVGDATFERRVHFGHMPLDHLLLETITIRSDRRIGRFLELFYERDEGTKLDEIRAGQWLHELGLPDLQFYRRRISKDEILPWQLVFSSRIARAETAYYQREDEARRAIGWVQ